MTGTYVADDGAGSSVRCIRLQGEYHVVCTCGASLVASDMATVIECQKCGLVAAVARPNESENLAYFLAPRLF